jgi:hypothetical protein
MIDGKYENRRRVRATPIRTHNSNKRAVAWIVFASSLPALAIISIKEILQPTHLKADVPPIPII